MLLHLFFLSPTCSELRHLPINTSMCNMSRVCGSEISNVPLRKSRRHCWNSMLKSSKQRREILPNNRRNWSAMIPNGIACVLVLAFVHLAKHASHATHASMPIAAFMPANLQNRVSASNSLPAQMAPLPSLLPYHSRACNECRIFLVIDVESRGDM